MSIGGIVLTSLGYPIWGRRLFLTRTTVVLAASVLVLSLFSCPGIRMRKTTTAPPATAGVPKLVRVGAVAPNVLGIVVEAGKVFPSRPEPYTKEPGDEIVVKKTAPNGDTLKAVLKRGDTAIGYIAGSNNEYLWRFEEFDGVVLNTDAAGACATYILRSSEDSAYAAGVHPVKVSRKSKPVNWTHPNWVRSPLRHYVYLHLPEPLKNGMGYTLDLVRLGLDRRHFSFRHDPMTVRSEAVHVSHVGFRPDDPGKRAYLSLWMGDGGAMNYSGTPVFHLVDTATGEPVFTGNARLAFAADDTEHMFESKNHNYTDVWHMDFGEFRTPGVYRVAVEGIGSSFPFRIARDVWEEPFRNSMKGFLNQRSGIELGPPHVAHHRPRDLHPDDGLLIRASNVKLGEGRFKELPQRVTGETIRAWGGYHDAGDWDRHTGHLVCSRMHLDLLELFPEVFAHMDLGIPESGNELPDILDEALWNIDCYRRLQTNEGGVHGGIESAAHPREGDVSWIESLDVFAYAPDIRSTYRYAGLAARAALLLKKYGAAGRAGDYELSALKAITWAENRPGRHEERFRIARNMAVLELYRLTGADAWHKIFRNTSSIGSERNGQGRERALRRERRAAFLYARLKDLPVDTSLWEACHRAITAAAEHAVAYQPQNAFNIASSDSRRALMVGFFSTPHAVEVAWAHYLTGSPKYLECLVRACNFGMGANPMNMTLTTGVGHQSPRNPLHIDSRRRGQPAPKGITVYGPNDFLWEQGRDGTWSTWPFKFYFTWQCYPDGYTWPITESYFDVFRVPSMNEFTVGQTMAPASFVWGYLHSRASHQTESSPVASR